MNHPLFICEKQKRHEKARPGCVCGQGGLDCIQGIKAQAFSLFLR
jgi:hypothetical protein